MAFYSQAGDMPIAMKKTDNLRPTNSNGQSRRWGEMGASKYNSLYDKVWVYLLQRLQTAVDQGITQKALAKQIGVTQPTIGKWLRAERGKAVAVSDVAKVIRGLGIPMKDIAEGVGEKDLAKFFELYASNEDVLKKISAIIETGGTAKRKLESDIDFIYSQIIKKPE